MTVSYSDRELQFCENIAGGMPKLHAAIKAGYAETSAAAQATRLLKKDKIKAKVRELQESRRVRAEIDGQRVIKEIAAIAFSDVTAVFDDDWQIQDKENLPPQIKRSIKSLQVKERKNSKGAVVERVVTVRMHDKLRALDQLSVQLGLRLDDVTAIAALLKYGTVRRTDTGIVFDYSDIFAQVDEPYPTETPEG